MNDNFNLQQYQVTLKAAFEAVKTWVTTQIGSAISGIKGGVSSAFDTLKKVSDHFTAEINTLNNTIGTKASTEDLNNAVQTINQTMATKASTTAVEQADIAVKNELRNGANVLTNFAAVEQKIANQDALIAAIQNVGATGGDIINITKDITLPKAPKDAEDNIIVGKQAYLFNEVSEEEGAINSEELKNFTQVAAHMKENDLPITNGDMLYLTFEKDGKIVDAKFHNDKTKKQVDSGFIARNEDIAQGATSGKYADNAQTQNWAYANFASKEDFNALNNYVLNEIVPLFQASQS